MKIVTVSKDGETTRLFLDEFIMSSTRGVDINDMLNFVDGSDEYDLMAVAQMSDDAGVEVFVDQVDPPEFVRSVHLLEAFEAASG